MKHSVIMLTLLLSHCPRKVIVATPPPGGQVVRSYVDTLYDTLRYFAKLEDTVRLERTALVLRYDTLRNVVQVSQVLKTPMRVDTVRLTQYVITQQPAPSPPSAPGMACWVWVAMGVGVLALLILIKVLR